MFAGERFAKRAECKLSRRLVGALRIPLKKAHRNAPPLDATYKNLGPLLEELRAQLATRLTGSA